MKVDRNCLIMFKKIAGILEIAIGDPDVNRPGKRWKWKASKLTPLKISFRGKWELVKPVEGVKVIMANKEKTIIECACIDGKAFNFSLKK